MMRRRLGTIFLLLIIITLVGLYEGWFNISTEPGGENTTNVHVSVDRGKIRQDEQRAKKELEQVGEKIKEHIHTEPPQSTEN
jgi:hypothetical protein